MKYFSVKQEHPIVIAKDNIQLNGILYIPEHPVGIVIFAHGSGSSRFSQRNHYVAKIINEAKLATLLFDLLTEDEEAVDQYSREFRFDIELLSTRLVNVTDWVQEQSDLYRLGIGYFGSSTGAAAALVAAAQKADLIKAVVSRGGRPDLAGHALSQVQAPTLLIVGGDDTAVIQMNKDAMQQMHCEKKLAIIPGATHLFEEPGTLDQVAVLAKEWFVQKL